MSKYKDATFLRPSGNSNDGISLPSPLVYLDGSQAVGAAMTTVPVLIDTLDAYSIQFATRAGDTLVGTLTLQGSNERGNLEQQGQPDVTLKDWTTLQLWDYSAGAYAANKAVATGAQSILIGSGTAPVAYRWVRLVFAFTSGTANAFVTLQRKGWA